MALDSRGRQVALGDWMIVSEVVVRVVGLSETTKTIRAVGAYVDTSEGVRVKRFVFDPSTAPLVLKADGTQVV